jgi:hypothetical protein
MNEAQTRQNKIDPKSENRFWLQPANKYWLEQVAWSEWNMLEEDCSLEAEPDFMRYGMFNMEYTKYDIAIIRRLCEMA